MVYQTAVGFRAKLASLRGPQSAASTLQMQTRPRACLLVETIRPMWKKRKTAKLIRVFRDNSIASTRRENMPFLRSGQVRFFDAEKFLERMTSKEKQEESDCSLPTTFAAELHGQLTKALRAGKHAQKWMSWQLQRFPRDSE